MLCGHHRTSLRLLVEHQILKEYIEQQADLMRPYIPALKGEVLRRIG